MNIVPTEGGIKENNEVTVTAIIINEGQDESFYEEFSLIQTVELIKVK